MIPVGLNRDTWPALQFLLTKEKISMDKSIVVGVILLVRSGMGGVPHHLQCDS